MSRRGFRSIPREPGARTRDALPNFAATTEANTPGSSCRSPLAQDCLCVLAGGTFLPRTTCRRGGAVRSARQVKRGFTAVPDKDGSVTNTEGLISKHLFHRLYNSNSIASKTHEHNHARGGKHPRTPARTANPVSTTGPRTCARTCAVEGLVKHRPTKIRGNYLGRRGVSGGRTGDCRIDVRGRRWAFSWLCATDRGRARPCSESLCDRPCGAESEGHGRDRRGGLRCRLACRRVQR